MTVARTMIPMKHPVLHTINVRQSNSNVKVISIVYQSSSIVTMNRIVKMDRMRLIVRRQSAVSVHAVKFAWRKKPAIIIVDVLTGTQKARREMTHAFQVKSHCY